MDTTTTVTITAARLAELEALAAFALKVKAQQAADLTRLSTYDKAHPDKVSERIKRYKEKNREAYNARRRELRRLKREAAAAPPESNDPALLHIKIAAQDN